MFLHFFIMKSQFVDPVTINSKEDVITFQNTGSKRHVPEMKRHSPVINQVSPLRSLPVPYHQHQNRQTITYGQIQKNNTETSFTLEKNNFFNSSPERIKYFSELYFYWENDEKIMEKSVFICQMIHVCVIGGISQSSC